MAARATENSCSMGGIHAAAASSTANWEGSGISEALGEAAAGFKGEALSSGSPRGDVEQGVSTSERAENSLHSWATSSVRPYRASGQVGE